MDQYQIFWKSTKCEIQNVIDDSHRRHYYRQCFSRPNTAINIHEISMKMLTAERMSKYVYELKLALKQVRIEGERCLYPTTM